MKTIKWIIGIIALLLLGAIGGGNAWADRRHAHAGAHVGVVIGPYWGPWYYPPPAYYYPPSHYYPPYYPPVVVERPLPQVYIEQPQAPAASTAPPAAAPTNYWYYCATAKAYYPYVKECASGWQKVLPQPAGQP